MQQQQRYHHRRHHHEQEQQQHMTAEIYLDEAVTNHRHIKDPSTT